ncbi:MAG: Arc family DNA-binding protein [Methylococcaceae bacterium]|nr:MAG: Arc family DNA-binding protein [Methylococcaceae bacterium]
MTTITLKNVPEPLHQRLKISAAQNHRSMNREIIACLEAHLMPAKRDVAAKLAEISALQQRIPLWTTPEEVESFIQEGRQ